MMNDPQTPYLDPDSDDAVDVAPHGAEPEIDQLSGDEPAGAEIGLTDGEGSSFEPEEYESGHSD